MTDLRLRSISRELQGPNVLQMANLRSLRFVDASDVGFLEMVCTTLVHLRTLEVIDATSLRQLAHLRHLTSVKLWRGCVAACLPDLLSVPSLRDVQIGSGLISPAQVEEFRSVAAVSNPALRSFT
eukprot:TRINITY_DN9369_c0_g1_i1.p1 TRINITY_DN9369_c0_g1~~TRINITY_DN9369_c0_g1_i1.p1  ORF type:complete len:125 (-),score=4.76 TRINITY_DN9369_c0_g1_i1:242-616(-)